MKFIVNADDFGYTKGVTDGIIEGYKKGIVTSTTALCNMPNIQYAAKQSKGLDLGIGVHLTLTLGSSLTKNKTLTDENGNFFSRSTVWKKELDPDEVYQEFKAQIEKFIEVFGKKPTHLDSHHGVHDLPGVIDAVKRLAEEYGLPLRGHNHYKFVPFFYMENVTTEGLINILKDFRNEDIEIMAHPGHCDLELYQNSSYALERVKELAVLCDEKVKDYIAKENIELTNYHNYKMD